MQYSFNDTVKQAEKDYGLGKGEYFKVQDGDNKIRILSACIAHQGEFKGNPTFKFVCWIIDRRDSKVKLYFMPPTIMRAIGDLQMDDDYAFEEVPMPYDLNIRTKNAGTKEVEYTVIPSPKPTLITEAELTELNSKPEIEEVVQKLKEGQKAAQEPNSSVSEDSDRQGDGQEAQYDEFPL